MRNDLSQAAQLCVTMANLGATLLLLVQFSVLQKSGDRQTKKKKRRNVLGLVRATMTIGMEKLCAQGFVPFLQ